MTDVGGSYPANAGKVSTNGWPGHSTYMREFTMADKSPKKSSNKKEASKSLKEKRADKKSKAAAKPTT